MVCVVGRNKKKTRREARNNQEFLKDGRINPVEGRIWQRKIDIGVKSLAPILRIRNLEPIV